MEPNSLSFQRGGSVSYDDFSDIAATCIIQDLFARLVARKHDVSAPRLSASLMLSASPLMSRSEGCTFPGASTFAAIQSALSPADIRLAARMRRTAKGLGPDAHEMRLGGGPDIFHTLNPSVILHLDIHLFRCAAQRKFSQGEEVPLPEKVSACLHGEFGHVYLSIANLCSRSAAAGR